MAKFILNPQHRRLNQFVNRSSILSPPNTSEDILDVITNITTLVSNVTSSLSELSESNNKISQSITGFSDVLTTQSMQIEHLTVTSRSIGSNKLFSNKEIPVGEINGINTKYILSNEPILGSDHIYLNGVLIEDNNNDYSISGSIITFSTPLSQGMKLRCTYYYQDPLPQKLFIDKEQPHGSINGENTSFTLNNIPVEGSEHIYLNGLLQENGGDYTMSGLTITFLNPPPPLTKIYCTYYYFL